MEMPSERIKGLIRYRDDGICWHCGTDVDVTIHHRQNRGMGGKAKFIADRPSNLIAMCQEFNFLMEADLDAARLARNKGWKLRQTENPISTQIIRYDLTVWMLDDHGKAHRLEQPGLF